MAGLAGRILGGYELTEEITGAGIADVYRGRPAKPGGREVIVKVFYPEFARQPGFVPHFRHIVQMSTRLAAHPHILPLLAGDEDGGYLYLVTPYVAGGTLKGWVSGGGRLGALDVAPFFRQLCEALTYAHNLGVVHGNLKPSNVFLYEGRHVMLGDFGLLWDAALVDMDHAGSGADAVEFLAPEAIGGQQTHLSDIYSVGVMLFYAITGIAPFRGARLADVIAAHKHQPAPRLEQINPLLPAPVLALNAVIQRALAKHPEDRFPSAAALAQALETAVRQAPQWPQPPQVPATGAFSDGLGSNLSQTPAMASQQFGSLGVSPAFPGTSALSASPSVSVPLQPLDPPFPPLSITDDPQDVPLSSLSVGAVADGGNASSSDAMHDAAAEMTMRVPAPPPHAHEAVYTTESTRGQPGDSDEDAGYTGPQEMPVIRLPRIADAQGNGGEQDVWANSTARLLPDELFDLDLANKTGSEQAVFPNDRLFVSSADNFGSADSPEAGTPFPDDVYADSNLLESSDQLAWRSESEHVPTSSPISGAGASPTQLGLPRLTNPQSPNVSQWRSIVSESLQLPSFDVPAEQPHEQPLRWSDAGDTMWGSDSSGASLQAPVPQRAPVAGGISSAMLDPEPRTGSGEMNADRVGISRRGSLHADPEEPDAGFEDERDWTMGVRSLRPRRRWPRRIALLLTLVMLLDMALVVTVRPDLCPNTNCRVISAVLRQHAVVILHAGVAAGPLTVIPSSLTLTTSGTSVSGVPIQISNSSNQTIAWDAHASLPWLDVSPVKGTLGPGSGQTLTLTPKSTGVRPGPYTAQLQFVAGNATAQVPISIAVGAVAALSVVPSSLSFATCGTSQTITLRNSGDAPLTFQAVPSESAALSLKGSSGSIPAGKSTTATVTLSCEAAHGASYTVNITSTDGSAVVAVRYP